jgi:hypothetical protein
MGWMPSDRIGVIVMSNLSGTNPVPTIVMRRIYDELLGLPPVDWMGRTRDREAATRKREAAQSSVPVRVEGTSPTHALADYVGTYEHRAYGAVQIGLVDGALTLTVDGVTWPLRHFHYDVFRTQSDGRPGPMANARVTFSYGSDRGNINSLEIPLEPTVTSILFARRASR